jgi:putative peptide maturation system protein
MVNAAATQASSIVAEVATIVVELQRTKADPIEARRVFRELETRHAGVAIMMIAQRERWSGAHHFDVVIAIAGDGAFTLSFCADRGAPWMTRNASRLDDDVVARIDGVPIRVHQAIDLLDLGHDTELADKLITAVLIRDGIDRMGLAAAPIDDRDLQRALDDFRITRGLYDAAETERWLDDRGLTLAILERSLEDQVRARMLRDRVAAAAMTSELDDDARRRARDAAFATWLAQRRAEARIEWCRSV